jgi:fibronectin-binding autotransporter adhesin
MCPAVSTQGGKIVLSGGDAGNVTVSGILDATGDTGGEIVVTGQAVGALDGAVLDASGTNGGGKINFGGAFQGGDELPGSEYTYIDNNAILRANAEENGDGGDVVVWSDGNTVFKGDIEAKGGANSGNGGDVEVSGLNFLSFKGFVDTSALNGLAGILLLDPENFVLRLGTNDSSNDGDNANNSWIDPVSSTSSNTFADGTASEIWESEIEGQNTNFILRARRNFSVIGTSADGTVALQNNSSLTIETENGTGMAGTIDLTGSSHGSNLLFRTTGTGNITIQAGVQGLTAGNIILSRLQSQNGNIFVDANSGSVTGNGTINATGTGTITLSADAGTLDLNGAVTSNGGLIQATASDDLIVDAAINAGTGGITLANTGGSSGTNDTNINAALTSTNGNIQVLAASANNVNINSTVTTAGAGGVTVTAGDDILTDLDAVITTGGGAVNMTAGSASDDNIHLDADVNTNGGVANFAAGGTFITDNDNDTVTTNGGNITVHADQIVLSQDDTLNGSDVALNAGSGTVFIDRATDGDISLGDNNGGLHLSQFEIAAIDAANLTVGGNNTSEIFVQNVNTTIGTITNLVSLITGVNTGDDDDVNFLGTNTFNALNVLSNDDINFVGGAIVNVLNGDANFEGDTNDGSVGDFNMFSSSFLNTNGHNVNVSALGVTLYAGSIIDTNGGNVTVNTSDQFGGGLVDLLGGTIDATGAAGGDILINNEGRFYSLQANSLKTNNGGTITLNQWDQNGGSLQNAINALDNAGTGQNTLYAYKGTGDGTYTENLNINQAQLKLTGIDDGIGGPDVTIAGTMTVNASNFHLDPVVVDALGGAYGVIATGAGFNGFSSVGNTYKNSTVAGILLNGSTGTATVQGNTFEGNATRGVEISGLTGGLALINGNNMGVVNGNVVNGVWASGAITGGGVGIGGNTIVATGAGALFGGAVSNASVVITASNNITGIDGIEFSNNVTNSIVNISGGNTIIGTGNASFSDAIDFRGLVTGSTVNINNNTLLRGADDGIQVIGGIRGGTFTVSGNTQITGLNGDGIALLSLAGGGGNGNAISNGAEVEILNNTITGNGPEGDTDNGDGAVSDGVLISGNVVGAPGPDTILEVSGNTITGYNNGVHLFGDVSEAVVQVNGNDSKSWPMATTASSSRATSSATRWSPSTAMTRHHRHFRRRRPFLGLHRRRQLHPGIGQQRRHRSPPTTASISAARSTARRSTSTTTSSAANQDGGFVGSGIYFANTINNATINIGDGERDSNPSNFISVGPQGDGDTDGIHFAGNVGTGAAIKIDGNRIGYNGDGTVNAINGDGIEFAVGVNGNADIDIIDNRVRAIGNASGTGDGVKFSGHIGGTANVAVGVASSDGNNIDVNGNGVEFNGITGGTVSVASNTIVAGENGVEFGAGSPSIEGGADVFVLSNTINATLDGIYVDDDITGAGTTFTAKRNTITAGDDGIDVDHVLNGAVVHIGGPANGGGGPLNNEGNRITANGNGIEFDAGIDATVLVQKNRISAGDDGINIRDEDPGNTTAIDGGALVNILDNEIGSQGTDTIGGHGINVEEDVTGDSTINIARNNIGRAGTPVGLNGIQFGGAITNLSNVNIFANNHGIHAQDHGIYFGGPINGGATVDIDDNIISANEDNAAIGSGIFFDGVITNATINIGDGTGGSENSGGSNVILVADNTSGFGDSENLDGIHFNKNVGQGAVVNIDGNRIGYGGNTFSGPYSANDVADDGIEFRGTVNGNADINITDNWIRASDDGIIFDSLVTGNANILIGGDLEVPDGNRIIADDDGIQFGDDLTGQALVEISYNHIDAESDGIVFFGEVNNALDPANSEQELLITRNDIWGRENGIHFAGAISNARHDTVISFNTIEGEDEQGVVFDSTIDDAHIRINNNTRIEGEVDGVRFLGEVDSAQIDINDNIRIQGNDEEAIHFFQEIDESTINIIGNDNLVGGDHGIEFAGVIDESDITISDNNDGIHADNHGILFGAAIEDDSVINIHDNIISANEDGGAEGDGIHFVGTVTDSDIFIGDGLGSSLTNDPSNVISGVDGIHFAANIGQDADIVIDGNRIGYNEPRLNPSTGAGSRVTDDGISFAFLSDNAEITITDNWIRSADDGIIFNNNVDDDVRVLIGGDNEAPDGNTINAWGDGIQFAGDITENSLVEISYNDIEADDNGIEFDGYDQQR